MLVKILKEAGYEEALLGLSLSFYDHKLPLLDWETFEFKPDITKCRKHFELDNLLSTFEVFWSDTRYEKAQKVALHLANKTIPDDYEIRNNLAYISAEQKFLEQIDVWIYIQASRDFWSEFDTYRVDISKQSSSTMHTLSKREVTIDDFEEGTCYPAIMNLNGALADYNNPSSERYHNVSILKKNLPEGWLQERVVKTSYKTLKWIIEQREGHRLEQWKYFVSETMSQLQHPEYIKYLDKDIDS